MAILPLQSTLIRVLSINEVSGSNEKTSNTDNTNTVALNIVQQQQPTYQPIVIPHAHAHAVRPINNCAVCCLTTAVVTGGVGLACFLGWWLT